MGFSYSVNGDDRAFYRGVLCLSSPLFSNENLLMDRILTVPLAFSQMPFVGKTFTELAMVS